MRPLYVMLVGLPAAGKTTLARKIMAEFPGQDWHIVSTDDYVETEAAKAGLTYTDVFKDTIDAATKDMNERRQYALGLGRSIIHDQTNLTAKSRARKLAAVPKTYLRIGILCDCMTLERARRLSSRPGKVISSDIDRDMIAQFESITIAEFDVISTADYWKEALMPHADSGERI